MTSPSRRVVSLELNAQVSDAKLQDNTTLRSCAQLGEQKMCAEEVTSFTFQMGVDDPALRRYRVADNR